MNRPWPLLLIVLEKAFAAVGTAVASVLAFSLRGRAIDPLTYLFAGELAEDPHDAFIHWLLPLRPLSIHVPAGMGISIGLLLWSLLFALEAVGLWWGRRWGEPLVIVESASFLPFEIWGAVRQPRVTAWVTLAINALVLVYVVQRVRRRRRQTG